MKLISRSLIVVVLLMGLAMPALTQNPAVRMTPGGSKACVKVTLKNLNTAAPITVSLAELLIFDQKTCRRLCIKRLPLNNKKIDKCQTLDFEICCPQTSLPDAPGYIYFLRISSSAGSTQDWLFVP